MYGYMCTYGYQISSGFSLLKTIKISASFTSLFKLRYTTTAVIA